MRDSDLEQWPETAKAEMARWLKLYDEETRRRLGKVELIARRAEVHRLRSEGKPFREIAKQLDIPMSVAHADAQREP